jgi:hypothetical protein
MARRTQEARVDWKHLAIYGLIVIAVGLVGLVAIWSFIEKQSLVLAPEPLPKVTVVTADSHSRLAASWVRLLTKAELPATLVPLETFDPIEGVVLFCDVPQIPQKLADTLVQFQRKGGALAFIGEPPTPAIGKIHLSTEKGMSDPSLRLSEAVSPLLARLNPGGEIQMRSTEVVMLKESPRMVIDARWRDNSRAALMHTEDDGARYIWLGFDPEALVTRDDKQMLLLLRTAFRWVAGQPVSDGAIGQPQLAKTLTPDARRDARANHFAFSVDRLPNPKQFGIRMTNRGGIPLANPTVKIWLPPGVTQVALAGDFIMKRNAEITGVPEEGACLVSLPSLTRNEDRVMKLKIVEVRPRLASR